MGNSIYESVVAKLNVLVPMLGRTQVDIGLSRIGTDPFHVTAVQMAHALNTYILPRIQQITHQTATIDLLNVAQIVTGVERNLIKISANFSMITGVQYAGADKFKELVARIVPPVSEFDRYDLVLREVLMEGRTLVVTSSLDRNPEGKAVRIISHISDQTLRQKLWSEVSRIHDQLEAEVSRRIAELEASKERYRRSLEGAADAILIFDRSGKIQYANTAAVRLLGYETEEFPTLSIPDIVAPSSREHAFAGLAKLVGTDSLQEQIDLLRKEGRVVPVEIHAVSLGEGNYQAIVRDETDRRIAEGAIRQKEEHIRTIIETLPVVIYDRFPDGTVSYISPNIQALWGYRPEEFHLDPEFWVSCVHPEDRNDFRAGAGKARIEYRFFSRKKNSYIWIQDFARGETDAAGMVQRYRGIMADITQQKELQSQVFQSQKMEMIGTLAAGIAHDFNNQLTGIMSNIELASIAAGPGASFRGELQDAMNSARRCAEMTQSILTFGRGMPGNFRLLNLNKVVDETVRLLMHSLPPGIQVKVITNPELWPVKADETRILQMLMNLAFNGRDAMGESGTLMIETDNHLIDNEYCSRVVEARPGKHVMISVGDTGAGIDEKILPRIFEPFFTTKEFGRNFGMGLASVYGIVKAHEGWVEVTTHPGSGSNFRIFLPRVPDPVEVAPIERLASANMILVVDDEEVIRRMNRRVLEQFGYQVIVAGDGPEAIQRFHQNATRIDAVVLDFTLPGQAGDVVFQEIRRVNPEIPVILATGYASSERAQALVEQGAQLLAKPYTATQLIDALRRLLPA